MYCNLYIKASLVLLLLVALTASGNVTVLPSYFVTDCVTPKTSFVVMWIPTVVYMFGTHWIFDARYFLIPSLTRNPTAGLVDMSIVNY